MSKEWIVSVEVTVAVDPEISGYVEAQEKAMEQVGDRLGAHSDDLKLRWEVVDAEPKHDDDYDD